MLGETELVVAPVEGGEHDVFSHYANKYKMLESRVNGTPVKALCGKTWVPWRDPKKYPLCPTCAELYESGDFPDDA